MNREIFLNNLESEFPQGFMYISDFDKGLLHCEIASFRCYVEDELIKESCTPLLRQVN